MTDTQIAFERYNEEFNALCQQIETSLAQQSASPQYNYTTNLLQQCDDLMKQMALEARSADNAALKRELLQRVRECKSKCQGLQQQADKQSLLSSNNHQGGNRSAQDRLLLQKNEDMLGNQNETLERARRSMQDTEQVALEITEELGSHREKLVSAHGRIREVSGLTGRARRVLQSMSQRAVRQKMVMYGVAVGLVLVFLIMLYGMYR